METICIKTRIKPGHIEEVRLWFKTLQERRDETLETLRNEGVFIESAFIDKQGVDLFLIYYMKAESINKKFLQSQHLQLIFITRIAGEQIVRAGLFWKNFWI